MKKYTHCNRVAMGHPTTEGMKTRMDVVNSAFYGKKNTTPLESFFLMKTANENYILKHGSRNIGD